MSAANQSVRTDRTAALTNLDAAESYLSVDSMPSQFELLTATADLIKGRKVTISDWTYDSGNLDLVLQADRPMEAAFYIESFEREYLTHLLGRHRGNISRAADEAGIDRNYIHRMVKKYGLAVQRDG